MIWTLISKNVIEELFVIFVASGWHGSFSARIFDTNAISGPDQFDGIGGKGTGRRLSSTTVLSAENVS